MNHRDTETQRDPVSEEVIGAAIEVHRGLGPGLLESAYEECLCYELAAREVGVRRQVERPVKYKTVKLDCGYRVDMIVSDTLVVEVKAVEKLLPVHQPQLLYLPQIERAKYGLIDQLQRACPETRK